MADSLAALGLELRDEAVRWLAELTPGALPDGTLAARELLQALGELEAEVAVAAAEIAEVDALQRWLTSGFFAAPEPGMVDQADAVDAAEPARIDGGLPTAPSPLVPRGADWVERTDGPARPGANEFAAGTSQSPPSRTAGAETLPRGRDFADASSGTGDVDRPDPRRDPAGGDIAGPPARTGERPEAAGGIQGLAALAALAGRGGMEIPAAQQDADRAGEPIDQRRPTPSPVARETESASRDRASLDGDRSPRGTPEVERTSAARSVGPAIAREVERSEEDAVHLPSRIIRRPSMLVEWTGDVEAGWSADAPMPIPFLGTPAEAEWTAPAAETPRTDAPAPGAIPTLRVFGGAEPELGIAPDAREEVPRESADAFLARAAQLAGRRLRPAEEIVRSATAGPTADAASAPVTFSPGTMTPVPGTGAGVQAHPVTPSPPHPVTALEAETPSPVPDMTDLLDALASEIAHEYRRYYGE